MHNRDMKDLIGGALMVLFGGVVVVYGLMTMSMGTPQRMGPGFFPIAVGILLSLVGIGIFVPALFRPGTLDPVEWRPVAAITLGTIAFGLTLPVAGLIPAIFILVAISTLAQRKISIFSIVLVAGILSVLCHLVFNFGLGIGLPMARWPF